LGNILARRSWSLGVTMFPMGFYGCEAFSVTFKEEHKLKVFEDRLLKRIFESKKDLMIRRLEKTS
jgi:hypothetical protein